MTTFGVWLLGCWGGFGLGLLFAGAARAITGPAASPLPVRLTEALEGYGEIAAAPAKLV